MRYNHLIRSPRVNLIDENGQYIENISFKDAINMASEKNLDLVEVNPNSNPPTCKLMDFGKYKYQQKKNQKPQKVEVLKEMELSVGIGEHDFSFKMNHIQEWINEDYKVLIKLRFKGRQITHFDLGKELINRSFGVLSNFQIEKQPSLNGKILSTVIKKAKQVKTAN